MKAVGVIPARWASTRFEGKVLALLNGKPVIQHVWERAKKCRLLDEIIIACDDERILTKAAEFGAKAVLTAVHHSSGTDRIAEAVSHIPCEIIVNIQGDEPLIQASVIDALAEMMIKDSSCVMATVIKEIEHLTELSDPNVVKVVIDRNHDALYFSRAPIPFLRDKKNTEMARYYKHLGLYAYRRDFLFAFQRLPKSRLEQLEQLEQLRVLEAGYKIKTIETHEESIGIDTPEDLKKAEALSKLKI